MVIQIPLSKKSKNPNKYIAIVDDCDADLAQFNWCANHRKGRDLTYAQRKDNAINKTIQLHCVVMERVIGRPLEKGEYVDHINRDALDNQRDNLRLATHQQNMGNMKKASNNTSGYKGVSWCKRNQKYIAQIRINGGTNFLGYFDNPEDAHNAYKKKATESRGDFARFE